MKFSETLPVTLKPAVFQDPAALIRCIPGVEEVETLDDGTFSVKAVNGIGPIRLRLSGTARVEAPEPSALVAHVTLHDALSGTIYGTFSLSKGEDGATVEADLTLGGKLGEFAQPLLRKRGRDTVRGFQENLISYQETL